MHPLGQAALPGGPMCGEEQYGVEHVKHIKQLLTSLSGISIKRRSRGRINRQRVG